MFLSRKLFGKSGKQNVLIFLYIFIIVGIIYYRFYVVETTFQYMTLRKYVNNHHRNLEDTIKMNNFREINRDASRKKNILFWTRFWNSPIWYLGGDEAGEEMLKSLKCPITNCFFTHNKSHLHRVTQFDAILFHGAEYLNNSFPNERSEHQLYVFANLISPLSTLENLHRFSNFYNLTMTYRLDSDIPWSFGKVYDISTKNFVAPSNDVKWRQPDDNFSDQIYLSIASKKSRSIVWFKSNCNSTSNREKLAESLEKYFQVDIYGKCGELECSKNSTHCKDMLTSNYMFYLSFENSLCRDYITEKLYDPLSQYIVPIVFNGADTSLYAPPYSYINANDFDYVEDLAMYLNFLMNNRDEYIKYFWWKKHYKIINSSLKMGFCDLCMKLHDAEFRKKTHIYKNIDSWWKYNVCTNESHIKF